MWPNKFSTKSEGSKRGKEGRWRERRVGEMHPHYAVTLWVLFSIRRTASSCGMAAWVPEMPGCVEGKSEGTPASQHRHFFRNYCKWNWPFDAMTKLRNDRLTAASLNPSNLHLLCHVPWARTSKSPTVPPSSTAPNSLKQIRGSAAASLAFTLWSRRWVQRRHPNPHLLLRREAVRQQHGNWGAMYCWHGMFTTHTWQF